MIKFPRFCPGCAQRKLQMNAAPCEICGRVNLVAAPKPRDQTHPAAQLLRSLLRAPGRKTHTLMLVAGACSVWEMTRDWIVPFPDWVSLALIFTAVLTLGSWGARLLTRVLIYIFAPATRPLKRGGGRQFAVLPLVMLGLLSLQLGHLPLRIAFWMSRGELETVRLAARMSLLGGIIVGRHARVYDVRYALSYAGETRFTVCDNGPLGTTQAGFLNCARGCSLSVVKAHASSQQLRWIPLTRDWGWWEERQ